MGFLCINIGSKHREFLRFYKYSDNSNHNMWYFVLLLPSTSLNYSFIILNLQYIVVIKLNLQKINIFLQKWLKTIFLSVILKLLNTNGATQTEKGWLKLHLDLYTTCQIVFSDSYKNGFRFIRIGNQVGCQEKVVWLLDRMTENQGNMITVFGD